MVHNINVKISERLNQGICCKISSKLPTLHISAQFAFVFYMGKSETICFKKMTRIKLFVHR